jgi:polar amino acid transport system ATP-binding protein
VRLSGGQQQRVAIARALAMDPKIMLFDEVTSALDPELVGEVLAAMQQLARAGMTMVVVTHEMSFARDIADRIVFMDDGLVVEQGKPDQLLFSPATDRVRAFLKRYNDRYRI